MRSFAIVPVCVAGILLALWMGWRGHHDSTIDSAARTKLRQPSAQQKSNQSPGENSFLQNEQIPTKSLSSDEVSAEVARRDRLDPKWEWKIPILFYGKVVDEASAPVPTASVHFQWTDLSGHGTSEAQILSDAHGDFSLNNVRGKRLSVRVTKPGYYSSDPRNRQSFEFANPFEEIHYQPDRTNPVVFYLRKKGEGAQLVKKTVEVALPGDGNGTNIDLVSGKISPNGELQIQAWKPWPPRPLSPHYDWKVLFTISDGGFIEAPAEFAFEAPGAVYSQPFEVNMPASAGSGWSVSAEKTLYFAFGQPQKYGRLHFRTDGASRYVFVDYVFNPTGSKNLEEASGVSKNEPAK